MENNTSEYKVTLKDFLDRFLGDPAYRVHTSWLDGVQAKKVSNEKDNAFLQQFNTLKTQIGNKANNLAKIEVMLCFVRVDEPMQQKIREQSSIPETKYDPVALAKKLRPKLDRELKPSLPTRTCPTLSTFAELEQSDALVASSSHEDSRRKGVFCSYCERKSPKEAQCGKKSCDAKQHKEARLNTARPQVATMNESGLSLCQA